MQNRKLKMQISEGRSGEDTLQLFNIESLADNLIV